MADSNIESIEFDVLYVGAGPASLSSAIHLSRLLKKEHLSASIAIIEKAQEVGAHNISGAILNPKALQELIPNFKEMNAPIYTNVIKDKVYVLTKSKSFRFPIVPPQLNNYGYYIISLNNFVNWLGGIVEKSDVDIFLGFPGQEILYDGDKVIGIRAGEKGIDRNGKKKTNYEAGVNIKAKVTIFAEGSHGSLTKGLINNLNLRDGKHPQNYATGVKELWEVEPDKSKNGLVIHTIGYPTSIDTVGGGFLYRLNDKFISIGYVESLNYKNPYLDIHKQLQKFKTHNLIKNILKKGKIVGYGAKSIPEGGYFSLPKYYGNGFLIIGDSAGFLSSQRLKGIHLAMKSGILAAEAVACAIKQNDFSEKSLYKFYELVEDSVIKKRLWKDRNFHQGFRKGLISGMFHGALQTVFRGYDIRGELPTEDDYQAMKKISEVPMKFSCEKVDFDNKITFDKLTCVYYSGTKHSEDQPCHLVISDYSICSDKCADEYGNPCQHFCPAGVYEMEFNEELKKKVLKLNPANCVHCKTCDIKDPYQIINWKTPEDGGPNYKNL